MSKRVRLTARQRKAVEEDTKFPGDIGNEEREYKERDKYHTFEHTVNHEVPDTRTEWKDNPRDDIGFGQPKVAKIYASAQKAVRLAVLFLGDKCEDKVIEAQARDFMRLGSARIETALSRFAETELLYAEEEAVNEGEEIQEVSAETEEAQKVAEDAANENPDAGVEDNEEKVEDPNPIVAEEEEVLEEEPVEEVVAEEEEVEDIIEDEEILEEPMDEVLSEDEEENVDVELSETLDDEVEEDAELTALFADDDMEGEDDEEDEVIEASQKTAKKGIKQLGGQPVLKTKTASAENLVGLWNDAPDVSDIF